MSAYVCYGRLNACVISGGFACTRDELPRELARVARPAVGQLLRIETYGTEEAAKTVADAYSGPPVVLRASEHR